jgi:nitroreductase
MNTMDVLEAIHDRRSVRSYSPRTVGKETVQELLRAAQDAPSAMNQQPWAFAVFEGADFLRSCSTEAKQHLLAAMASESPLARYRNELSDPAFNIFHGAPTLVAICARPAVTQSIEDCSLAAQNLMLAAHARGLGTCVIGFARPWLNLPAVKQRLGIPEDSVPVLPIIVGYPAGPTPRPARHEPRVVHWREAQGN